MAMEEVGEAGYWTEEAVSAWKVKLDFFAERIGLGGLYGECEDGSQRPCH